MVNECKIPFQGGGTIFFPLYFHRLSKCPPKNMYYFCNKEKIPSLGKNVNYEVANQDKICRVVIFVRTQTKLC